MNKNFDTMDRVMKLWEVELISVLDITAVGHRKRILASLEHRKKPDRQFTSLVRQGQREITPALLCHILNWFNYTSFFLHGSVVITCKSCVFLLTYFEWIHSFGLIFHCFTNSVRIDAISKTYWDFCIAYKWFDDHCKISPICQSMQAFKTEALSLPLHM